MPLFAMKERLRHVLRLKQPTQLTSEGSRAFPNVSLKTLPEKAITGERVRLIHCDMSGCAKTQGDRDRVVMRDPGFRPRQDELSFFFFLPSIPMSVPTW